MDSCPTILLFAPFRIFRAALVLSTKDTRLGWRFIFFLTTHSSVETVLRLNNKSKPHLMLHIPLDPADPSVDRSWRLIISSRRRGRRSGPPSGYHD